MASSSLEVLTRMSVRFGDPAKLDPLHAEAQELLGYPIASMDGKARNPDLPLWETLKGLGITPFMPSSIDLYRQKKAQEDDILPAMLTAVSFLVFLSVVGNIMLQPLLNALLLLTWVSIAGTVVLFILSMALVGRTQDLGSWQYRPISEYTGLVSSPVLSHMLNVAKENLPGVYILIGVLSRKNRVLANFLVVTQGFETYHVDAWEPEGSQ